MTKNIKKNKGFVLLFAVSIAAILLSIALGVANVALKEVNFGTSARDANNAFFAADSGSEYTLFNDKSSGSSYLPALGTTQTWNFVVSGLGSDGKGCAKVKVTKDNTSPPALLSSVTTDGYNNGGSIPGACTPVSTNVERELKITYKGGGVAQPIITLPIISKSFGAGSINVNATTSLSFTITNPNAASSLSGLIVNTPNGLSGSCGGGTISAAAGGSVVSLSGATLGNSAACTFSVTVLGTTLGSKTNTTTAVTSTEGGNGLTASSNLTVSTLNPTGLALSDSNGSRNFSVSWNAGAGNGGVNGCKLQFLNGSWIDIASAINVNCDAATASGFSLNGDGWKAYWNGTQVRLVRKSDLAVMGTFGATLNCTGLAGSVNVSTPNTDEDCDGNWDNYTSGSNLVYGCQSGQWCIQLYDYSGQGCSGTQSDMGASCMGFNSGCYSYPGWGSQLWTGSGSCSYTSYYTTYY
ncbi:hypothetical protein HY311_01715 [Candidatus Nomurabacteria bacterium]|nr:hypothetical protein [Candidatus Nomurabacteria bacterium]